MAADRITFYADVHIVRAVAEGLVRQDEDFLNAHKMGREHEGIAYFRQGSGIGYIVAQLLLLYEFYSSDEIRGRVECF